MGQMKVAADRPVVLRILIDTNVFISAEPYSQIPEDVDNATELIRLAQEQRHQLFIHPATRDDLLENVDGERRALRLVQLRRYVALEESPIQDDLRAVAGDSAPGSNDHRDLRILAALHTHAVTLLVTNDKRLLRRARRAGLQDNSFSVSDAVAFLKELSPKVSPPPPMVERVATYTLNADQPFFQSLRAEYAPNFDAWLNKVRGDSENRPCFVVTIDGEYAGIALLKHEDECEYPLAGPVVKISTFKVGADWSGFKYGELLLKSIFAYAHDRHIGSLYVTVFGHHNYLRYLFEEFGFVERSDLRTDREDELVLAKQLTPRDESLSALDYHKAYGPPALKLLKPAWVIPIEPRWHRQLFPDAPGEDGAQLSLPGIPRPAPKPWGNALRKAYLCLSKVKRLAPGDVILFYRSHDVKSITVVGIVESTLRTRNPIDIIGYVGKRTVYAPGDIAEMCERGSVLTILFRQDRFLRPPWPLGDLIGSKVLNSHPQSVTEVREEGNPWLQHHLAG